MNRAAIVLAVAVLQLSALIAQAAQNSGSTKPAAPELGAIRNGIYRNTSFGFTYKLPFGWVDRTQNMGDAARPDLVDSAKSKVLLAIFERPPDAIGETVNSAVVIAAEAASSYPGLRNAENYFGPLTELTKSKGLKVVNEPYAYPLGARQIVRGDFSKPLGNLTMHQSTLVMMEKGYVVSFTFIGGSEDEVDGLVEALSFGVSKMTKPK